MSKKKVWVDCDPGHDDAFALILAAYHPDLDLSLVTTVWGNQSLQATFENSLKVLDLSGVRNDLPVFAGIHQPLFNNSYEALGDEWGFKNTEFPNMVRKRPKKFLVSPEKSIAEGSGIESMKMHLINLKDKNEKIHLVATGCLTNIAVMFTMYNTLMHQTIQSITIMGGAIGLGNMSPTSEFNILGDPEAAKIVFDNTTAALPLTMVPLEVTHKALVTTEVLNKIDFAVKSVSYKEVITSLLLCFADTYKKIFNFPDPPLHDPVAVAVLIKPEICNIKRHYVEIVTGDHSAKGQTIVDVFDMKKMVSPYKEFAEKQFVYVAKDLLQVDQFWDMMIDALVVASSKT